MRAIVQSWGWEIIQYLSWKVVLADETALLSELFCTERYEGFVGALGYSISFSSVGRAIDF